MTDDERIEELAQSIYLNRHGRRNNVTGSTLEDFLDQTVEWVNQFIPEIEKKADWNFVRTNDDTVGTITDVDVVSYALPTTIRKLVVSPYRDLTIRQDGTIVSSFRMVNANQPSSPAEPYEPRDRATQIKRSLIFSRTLNDTELNGTIIADTIAYIPTLSRTDVTLLDLLDDYPDIRQLFVMGVVKNQILPDIVQGGLTPTYALRFDRYLADCIAENNASADADDQDRENFGWVTGVGF